MSDGGSDGAYGSPPGTRYSDSVRLGAAPLRLELRGEERVDLLHRGGPLAAQFPVPWALKKVSRRSVSNE